MRLYLDASVLVPLFTNDLFRQRAFDLVRNTSQDVVISDFGRAEFASAVSRKFRELLFDDVQASEIFAKFDAWAEISAETERMAPSDISAAEALVRRLPLKLRAPDAIHIAICQRLGNQLATFDARLAEAAEALDMVTVS